MTTPNEAAQAEHLNKRRLNLQISNAEKIIDYFERYVGFIPREKEAALRNEIVRVLNDE